MSIEKTFRHYKHVLNSYRAVVKRALREQREPRCKPSGSCTLDLSRTYYFIIEYYPNNEENILAFGLTCFDEDACIIFNHCGTYPVSLWRFRRQGSERTALIFRGLVLQCFQKYDVLLNRTTPFLELPDNVFQCNISTIINN